MKYKYQIDKNEDELKKSFINYEGFFQKEIKNLQNKID